MTASTNSAASQRPWADRLPPPIVMMGVPFDQVDTPTALHVIGEMIDSGQPHLLATANVDFLAQVQEDRELRHILVDADLVVCDGTPLVWMSKWLGAPLPERVAGSDLVPLLLDMASARGLRVFFLGGRDEVLGIAERKIRDRWPDLRIAGMYSPPFAPMDQMDHAGICRRIREAAPDILFVSFGCPKQEKWLARNYKEAGAPVAIGVGATIDFLAGAVKRAPKWMRRTGLEWFFRVCQEPRRLAGRYWRDIRVVGPGLLKQLLRMNPHMTAGGSDGRGPEVPEAAAPCLAPTVSLPVIALPERLDALAARDAALWPDVTGGSLILDASRTTFIDSTGTGKLVRLARTARDSGGRCILAGAHPGILRALDLMKLRSIFTEVTTVNDGLAVT